MKGGLKGTCCCLYSRRLFIPTLKIFFPFGLLAFLFNLLLTANGRISATKKKNKFILYSYNMTSAFGVFVSTCAWLMAINIFSSRYFLWAQNPFMCSSTLVSCIQWITCNDGNAREKRLNPPKAELRGIRCWWSPHLGGKTTVQLRVCPFQASEDDYGETAAETLFPRLSEQLTFCLCFPDDHHISSSTSWNAERKRSRLYFKKRRPRGEITHACTIERNV